MAAKKGATGKDKKGDREAAELAEAIRRSLQLKAEEDRRKSPAGTRGVPPPPRPAEPAIGTSPWPATGAGGGGGGSSSSHPPRRRACKYGRACYQTQREHLARFAHPGDRHYRLGLVLFQIGQEPEFPTLRHLFQFFDPEESGHLSREEFGAAARAFAPHSIAYGGSGTEIKEEAAWCAAGGPARGYVNFRQFLSWAETLGTELPVGLEARGHAKPCRFRACAGLGDGEGGKEEERRCECPDFEADPSSGGLLCKGCGHKASCHRSDMAERRGLLRPEASLLGWEEDKEGLVQVKNMRVLAGFQDLLDRSHKVEDNWTRDRGCARHGVNKCPWACASKYRKDVPVHFTLVSAYQNQCPDLWQQYSVTKLSIAEECSRRSAAKFQDVPVKCHIDGLHPPLDRACNEWALFHGSSMEACKGICAASFRMALAGTGATWKSAGQERGMPLYGYGIYMAECITKADEYSSPAPKGPEGEGLYCVLLCRVLGGRVRVVMGDAFQAEGLRADVFDGPYHSVCGDRVRSLGKPFREFVVYDKDQVYPAFLLFYTRDYASG